MSAVPNCRWCGVLHGPKCPLVKAIEYYPSGEERRVEFFAPGDYYRVPSVPPYWPPFFQPPAVSPTPALPSRTEITCMSLSGETVTYQIPSA